MPQLLGGSLTGRLPTAAAPLAIMLCVLANRATYAQAATVAAVYGLAATIGQPLLGRLVDHHGQRRPLLAAAGIATAALLVIPVAVKTSLGVALVAAAVAGLATPPLEGALRALWPTIIPADSLGAAYALDVASQSALFTAGPLLVSAATSALGPITALAVTAALGLAGTWTMVQAAPSRRWRPSHHQGDLLGPLRSHPLRRLMVILIFVGAAIGAQATAGTVWAHTTGQPTAAGLVLASFSVSSCIGGLLYSRTRWHRPAAVRLRFLLVAFTIAWLPLLLCPANTVVMCLLAALPGLFLSPLLGEAFQRVDGLVAPSMLTEANSWLVAAVGAGVAVGTAAGGAAADAHGLAAVYLAAAVCAAAAAAIALRPITPVTGRRALTSTQPSGRAYTSTALRPN